MTSCGVDMEGGVVGGVVLGLFVGENRSWGGEHELSMQDTKSPRHAANQKSLWAQGVGMEIDNIARKKC